MIIESKKDVLKRQGKTITSFTEIECYWRMTFVKNRMVGDFYYNDIIELIDEYRSSNERNDFIDLYFSLRDDKKFIIDFKKFIGKEIAILCSKKTNENCRYETSVIFLDDYACYYESPFGSGQMIKYQDLSANYLIHKIKAIVNKSELINNKGIDMKDYQFEFDKSREDSFRKMINDIRNARIQST